MSEVLYEDVIGEEIRPTGVDWAEITTLAHPLCHALRNSIGSGNRLNPLQVQSLEQGLLNSAGHFLISAPTNSGKTLIAVIRIFQRAIMGSKRSLYVVPLKALAEEKIVEFQNVARHIMDNSGPEIKIHITTGDYQLTGDFMGDPPCNAGDITICTPERLEVVLRNPDNHDWFRGIDTVVLDEFHLLGDPQRGGTVESILTQILVSYPQCHILGLSATIGGIDRVCEWLGHTGQTVNLIQSDDRYPSLHRKILRCIDKQQWIESKVLESLQNEQSLLIFVYKKNDAEKLAKSLITLSGNSNQIQYYHAGVPIRKRQEILQSFREEKIRILISTTSLKMGINTPSHQVVVRDPKFHGYHYLQVADLQQMLGRAGRETKSGVGYVLYNEKEDPTSTIEGLRSNHLEAISPPKFQTDESTGVLSTRLLQEISRRGKVSLSELENWLAHSWAGWTGDLAGYKPQLQIRSLVEGKLIYKEENSEDTYCITKLGRTVSCCGLSAETGVHLAKFLRALINLSEKSRQSGENIDFLRDLKNLDLLMLCLSSSEVRANWISPPNRKLQASLQEYVELLPTDEKPWMYRWRNPESKEYPTKRLLGTLGIRTKEDTDKDTKMFFQLMGTGILLYRHAKGEKLSSLSQEFQLDEGNLESGLKFTVTWLLSSLAQICDPDKCYKLQHLEMKIYPLLETISLGSELGKLADRKNIGRRTLQKLIDSGIEDLSQVRNLKPQELLAMGITGKQQQEILSYVKRSRR